MRISNEQSKGIDAKSTKKAESSGVSSKTHKTKAEKISREPTVESTDKVSISSKAKDVAQAKQIASKTSDVNEEKVQRLKKQVQEGTYKVDPERIADKLVDEHLTTMLEQ